MPKTKNEPNELLEKMEVLHDKLDALDDGFQETNQRIEKACRAITGKSSGKRSHGLNIRVTPGTDEEEQEE